MIRMYINILNPWCKDNFKNLFCKSFRLTKTKIFEVEMIRNSNNLFEFLIDTQFVGSDHAGFELEFGIFGYSMGLHLNDTRHWDYCTNAWEVYK